MAAATVFVDDAVLGRLPYLCVKTGAPAEGLLTVHTPVGADTRLGVWWLLVLAGPPGWLALVVLSWGSSGNGETLTVQVPWTEVAQHAYDRARHRRRNLVLAGIALAVGAFVLAGLVGDSRPGTLGMALVLVAAVACLFGAWLTSFQVERSRVDVRIDASRRWVTLGGVHDDFAHAVEVARSGRQATAPDPR
ncbi:MAG TPA: hypothetical protein VGO78_08030 [Acidimicrobiales bacterium]|jgi:hypothetical protein|nr:hypothetical protein [Acidimicrobiales bacterium]